MRVGTVICPLQLSDVGMGVVLCGGEGCVTHQLLNLAHISPLSKQLRGEGVAQDVGTLTPLYACSAQLLCHYALYGDARQRFARGSDNQFAIIV